MINIKVGQTIKINAAVWDFCGQISQAIYIPGVLIDSLPALDPDVNCQTVGGIGITFKLTTTYGSAECKQCAPQIVYRTLGTAYSDSQGMASLDYIVTEEDYASYLEAVAKGDTLRILACITDSKGQVILQSDCSDLITIQPAASPSYYIDFKLLENTSGILDVLKSYATRLTATINSFIPGDAGWNVQRAEVDTGNGILRLYLAETGSWSIVDIALFLFSIIITAIGALLLVIFLPVGLVGIGIIVAATIVLDYIVYRIIDNNVELQQKVTNLQAKDQNDTKLDQTVAGVLDLYEKSAKTKDDCLNKLNGLRISYTTYLDNMQKNFPNLYTPGMKRTFQATADDAIAQFRDGKITCERASEIIMTAGAIAKSDVSTNFTANYNTTLGYTPPKKDCWIAAPIGEDCILSASTGQWIVGTAVAVIGLGLAYWAVTRKPAETKIVFERAKEAAAKAGEIAKSEYERMKTAYREIRAPTVPATARARAPFISA